MKASIILLFKISSVLLESGKKKKRCSLSSRMIEKNIGSIKMNGSRDKLV